MKCISCKTFLKTLKYITGLGNVKRELILKESAGFKNQVGFDEG